MADKTIACGLTCGCDTLPSGQRVCRLPGSPNYKGPPAGNARAAADGPADVQRNLEAGKWQDTYTVVARVLHRDHRGNDKPHAVYGPSGLSRDEATMRAVEAGTAGIFDDLTYYPPARVLTVRLSHDA